MILAERGRHFDPAMVDAFSECHAEWRTIAARHADEAGHLADTAEVAPPLAAAAG
jgi:HD-GYP domain-containing protein (c-di-GMP phosphodiesterase class II)